MVFKFLEYYSLASFAFKPEAIWNRSQNLEIITNVLNANIPFVYSKISFAHIFKNNSYKISFWLSFVLAIIYLVITVLNSKAQEKGKLGRDKRGKPAKFPSGVWFKCMMINLLG